MITTSQLCTHWNTGESWWPRPPCPPFVQRKHAKTGWLCEFFPVHTQVLKGRAAVPSPLLALPARLPLARCCRCPHKSVPRWPRRAFAVNDSEKKSPSWRSLTSTSGTEPGKGRKPEVPCPWEDFPSHITAFDSRAREPGRKRPRKATICHAHAFFWAQRGRLGNGFGLHCIAGQEAWPASCEVG